MAIETLQTRPRMRYACDQLTSLAKKLGPNAQLPTMVQLRESLGVSMNTLHAALRELEKQQVLHSVHGVGIYVREPRKRVSTGNIGLLLHSILSESDNNIPSVYMQNLLSGIREGCRTHGKEILLIDDGEAAQSGKVDGILILSDKLEVYALGIPQSMPQVLIGQHADGITSVGIDDFTGGKLATSYLIEKGHRRIACLVEELMDEPIQRLAGYRIILREAGIEANPHWLKQTRKINLSSSFNYLDWGRQNMLAWLNEDWFQLGCTAIIVQNDHAAIGVIQVLQEAGIDVPGEVSVIGFDGTSICDLVRPRLTSVQVPFYQMGCEAVKVLCEQIQNGSPAPRNITLPLELREGNSVAKVN